ncbi:MAG: iron ABC transporter substrate-binding protein [Actinobacteria bacterium]|nr:iron ABC transporter substrate-binding protein [Actinomycetota bacterium]
MKHPAVLVPVVLLASLAAACGSGGGDTLTIYSGRSKELVGPLLEQFADETGVDIEVRYGDTAELAATILEEGDNSPADVFFAQDAGALGAIAKEDRLTELPSDLVEQVAPAFRSTVNLWIGTSGRARTLAFNPDLISEDELPDSILDLTDPKWKGKLGWAPTNGSFQAFVTALRVLKGDDEARRWLEGVKENQPEEFSANIPVVQAVGEGEISVGLVNHYYVPQVVKENPKLKVRNYFIPGGDVGGLVNVAGVGQLASSNSAGDARQFVEFLLSDEAQRYFAEETFEFPLVEGVAADPDLPALTELEPPAVDLAKLDDLRGTLDLLEDTGIL